MAQDLPGATFAAWVWEQVEEGCPTGFMPTVCGYGEVAPHAPRQQETLPGQGDGVWGKA